MCMCDSNLLTHCSLKDGVAITKVTGKHNSQVRQIVSVYMTLHYICCTFTSAVFLLLPFFSLNFLPLAFSHWSLHMHEQRCKLVCLTRLSQIATWELRDRKRRGIQVV